MTYVPYRQCPLRPRASWPRRLLSFLTLGAYPPPAPPVCQCILCFYHREEAQAMLDRLDEGDSEP